VCGCDMTQIYIFFIYKIPQIIVMSELEKVL